MPFTLTMPKLSPTMAEGTIAKWHKKPGDFVDAGDLLLEVSTDKATVEYNALDAGWLRKIVTGEGQKAAVGEPLAIFTEAQEETIEGYTPSAVTPTSEKPQVKEEKAPVAPQVLAPKKQLVTKASAPKQELPAVIKPCETTDARRVIASPLAKTLARQHGIDLESIKGSGPHGRIVSRDLSQAQEQEEKQSLTTAETKQTVQSAQKNAVPTAHPSRPKEDQHQPLSAMRKVIAERLQYSKSTIPHFYLRQEINVDTLVSLREETKKLGLTLTVNDFILKAVAIALKTHPHINCGYNSDLGAIIHYANIDIAVAVTISGGLITPIIREADSKPLNKLSQEVKALAQKAKEGKLQPHEFQGGSFTISNLGMYGVNDFQAIINPPQAAILAVGAVQDKPCVKNGAVVPGKILSVTLSCDHRVIDGAEGAQFLATLKQLLENPILFLAE